MRKHALLLLVAALVVALTASTAMAKPGKGKKPTKPAKTVTYVFKGTVAETPAEGATSLLVNVTDGNNAGRTAAKSSPQMSFGVLANGSKDSTKIELDEVRVALSDLRAGDAVVVQSKAPQGATSFTARIISAESPAAAPYFLDADGDGFGAGDPVEFAPNRVPEGYVMEGGDNCADVFNPDQADADGNGTGDACEPVEEPAPTGEEPGF